MPAKLLGLALPSSPASFATDPVPLRKIATGIVGFDEISGGGLPDGRATLIVGGPGTGKTVFALQALVNGAARGEAGIFVCCEESVEQLRANAATFGWDLAKLERDKIFLFDASLPSRTIKAGKFDLSGLLAGIGAKAAQMGARRVVFDSIDVLLTSIADVTAERSELYALREWLIRSDLAGIITTTPGLSDPLVGQRYEFLQFMADCVVSLSHGTDGRIAQRFVRVLKYRGSGFADNESPLVFGAAGIEIGGLGASSEPAALTERVSSGVARLDDMLDGGYFRGSSILVSGSPGTSKTTLAGAIVRSFCQRGERAVFFGFDESSQEILRNLTSVGLDLRPYVESELLCMGTARQESKNPEELLLAIRGLIAKSQPRLLVIDPISSIVKTGTEEAAVMAVHRLVRLAKQHGITLFLTTLLGSDDPLSESSAIKISTIADAWLHVSYVVNGGERNRALTVVKCRGVGHSNQVRELKLSKDGISLSDVYASGGEVLMGTARREKEQADRMSEQRAVHEDAQRREALLLASARKRAEIEVLERELSAHDVELARLAVSERRPT